MLTTFAIVLQNCSEDNVGQSTSLEYNGC